MTPEYELYSLFWQRVTNRVKQGERDYGNHSFGSSSLTLVEEVQQELEDICGWGYILWHRMEKLKKHLAKLESKAMLEEVAEEDGDDE